MTDETVEQIDFDARTIPAVVERAGAVFGDREGLVDGERRLTFAELAAAADEAGRAFIASGIERGDRVAIWAPNMGEWVIAALGAFRAGAVVVTVNTRFKGAEAAHVIATARARVLLTTTDFLDTDYVALLAEAGVPDCLEETVVLAGPVPDGAVAWADFLARGSSVDPATSAARAAEIEADDVSTIIFTSGTTGKPKGAMLRHGASVRAYHDWAGVVGLTDGDRYLIVNPFFHCFGLKAGILACLITGATIVPHPVFDVPSVMRRVDEERITHAPGGPGDLPDDPRPPRPRPVRPVDPAPGGHRRGHGAGRDDPPHGVRADVQEHRHRLRADRVDGHRHDVPPHRRPRDHRQHRGPAHPGRRGAGRRRRRQGARAGQPGEVVVRGYNVMAGYFGDEAATAEAIDADGWLHTGDVGVLDEGGNLKITDRTKDMFIVGGFNAYPAEIENMLMEHPSVGQVAVIGVPDHRMGEVGRAYVVPRAGATVDETELIAWAREKMANYKVPRSIEVVDALPLNATGKVLKYVLREQAAGG